MIQKIVQLTDRKIIQPRFQGLGLSISEYTFANIFLFRHVHGYELVEVDSKLFIRGMSYDKKTYLMPTITTPTSWGNPSSGLISDPAPTICGIR